MIHKAAPHSTGKPAGTSRGRSNAKKLVLIGPVYPYRGGIAHYTTMLYRALAEQGIETLMISFKRQYPQWLFPGKSDKDPSHNALSVENVHYWIDSLNPITWLATFQHIRRYQPDVIVLQWWTTFLAPMWFVLGMLNGLFLGRPVTIICHNVLPHEVHWFDKILAKMVLRWGTKFIVQSKDEQAQLLSLLPDAQTSIVPHPRHTMFVSQRIPQKQARERLGLPTGIPVLLFFGIVRKYKGLENVLRAIPQVRDKLGAIRLMIAGEFWEDKRNYLELIQQLGIEEMITIDDRYIPNEEIGWYFSAADVLVAPYRKVTGSSVVKMAQGFGLPVVTTATEERSASTQTGEGIMTVPPDDVQSLAEVLVDFLANRPEISSPTPEPRIEEKTWASLADAIRACEA